MQAILLTETKSDPGCLNSMEAEEIRNIATIFLISGIKFLFAPFTASEIFGYSFWHSFAITTSGGATGILVFTYVGDLIVRWWNHLVAVIKAFFLRRKVEAIERKPHEKFTRTNKLIVRVKRKFGIAGLAFLTPCILSIPIGTFVINRFFRKKVKILFALFVSLIFWSFVLNGIAQYLLHLHNHKPIL